MFQIGMEFEFSHLKAREHRKSVVRIAVASMVVPFAAGYALGYGFTPMLSPGASRTAAALFVGTAFSITALPILGRMLIEFDIARKPLGVIAISAAAINDVVGWLLLALVTMLSAAQFSPWQFGLTLLWLAVYMAVCWWLVRPLLRWLIQRLGGEHSWSNNLLGVILVLPIGGRVSKFTAGAAEAVPMAMPAPAAVSLPAISRKPSRLKPLAMPPDSAGSSTAGSSRPAGV